MLFLLGMVAALSATAVGCPSGTWSSKPAESVETDAGAAPTAADSITTRTSPSSDAETSRSVADGVRDHVAPSDSDSVAATRPDVHASQPSPGGSQVPFADWPQPDLVLFLTGRQHGYIEPCGCTGLVNAKGGLSRRFSLMRQLQEKGWNLVGLDVGNQVRRFGRQAELKFQTTVDVLKKMQYSAIGFGPDDLRLSFGDVYVAVADLDGAKAPFVCANVRLFDSPPRFRVIDTDLGKIAITSVLGTAEQKKVGTIDEIEFQDPGEALKDVFAELNAKACDYYVLLAHTSIEQSKELARQFPKFDLVVTAGGAGEPTLLPEEIDGAKAKLVQVGEQGMYVGIVGLYRDPDAPLRYERVSLDGSFGDSREVLDLFASYQNSLQQLGLEGLGLRPIPHPSGGSFVGSAVCGDCHTKAFEVFEGTPHFAATLRLAQPTERSEIPRHFDPECLSCHVTGWNPQGYFPYKSGYLDYVASEHLHSTGCESCHGPGSAHVAAENGEVDVTDEQVQQLRHEMRLTLEQAQESRCFECHDLDNSPDFHKEGAFLEYWEQIAHYGKD